MLMFPRASVIVEYELSSIWNIQVEFLIRQKVSFLAFIYFCFPKAYDFKLPFVRILSLFSSSLLGLELPFLLLKFDPLLQSFLHVLILLLYIVPSQISKFWSRLIVFITILRVCKTLQYPNSKFTGKLYQLLNPK